MDTDASLHGRIYGIFRKICPIAVAISYVLNSYSNFTLYQRSRPVDFPGSGIARLAGETPIVWNNRCKRLALPYSAQNIRIYLNMELLYSYR